MIITASTLRQNIYRLLDQVIETGLPIEIARKGTILKIVPAKKKDKLSNIKKRELFTCDPEDFVHIDWSSEWKV